VVPQLFDREIAYRRMGLLTHGNPLPVFGSIHFLAGASPDTAFGALTVTFSNENVRFIRLLGGGYEAAYAISLRFRNQRGRIVGAIADTQKVRVENLREVFRGDENIIYQRFVPLPRGLLSMRLELTDLGSGLDAVITRDVRVPDFRQTPALSSLLPVQQIDIYRSTTEVFPSLLVNPTSTVRYGTDTLTLYVEAYGVGGAATLDVTAVSAENGELVWQDSIVLRATGSVMAATLRVPTAGLGIGEHLFTATLPTGESSATPILVSFSSLWALTNFDQMLSLLRYFTTPRVLNQLRDAPPEERGALWEEFYRRTDPDQSTPQHEALEEYFARLQEANRAFHEPGKPGWRTDRGEVFLSFGSPDETFEPFPDPGSPLRIIRWSYITYRLVLEFVDQTGFGEFRLTDYSRSEFQRKLNERRGF
ncbi:MAG: GWxTD domain-containing protein, partial [Gemmatimonadales bacterium]